MKKLHLLVLRSMLTKATWLSFADVLTSNEINNSNVRYIYSRITDLHSRVDGDITPDLLQAEVEAQFVKAPERAKELIEVLVEPLRKVEFYDAKQLKPIIQRYVQREILADCAKKVALSLDDENLDAGVFNSLFSRAMEVTERISAEPQSIFETCLPDTNDIRRGICSLGLSDKLDSCIDGGVANGELANIVSSSGVGKTSILCNSAKENARKGKSVLYISMEISTPKVFFRIDQGLVEMTAADTRINSREVEKARKRMKERGGCIYVQNWSYKGATPQDVRGLVTRMRKAGKPIDFVIVDYLALMKPATKLSRSERRHDLGQLGIDMRAVAQELDVPILTAWQINRQGSRGNLITKEDIAEAWDIIAHCDIIVALNQSAQELKDKYMRVSVLKQRESTARPQVDLFCDLDRMIIRPFSKVTDLNAEASSI